MYKLMVAVDYVQTLLVTLESLAKSNSLSDDHFLSPPSPLPLSPYNPFSLYKNIAGGKRDLAVKPLILSDNVVDVGR